MLVFELIMVAFKDGDRDGRKKSNYNNSNLDLIVAFERLSVPTDGNENAT